MSWGLQREGDLLPSACLWAPERKRGRQEPASQGPSRAEGLSPPGIYPSEPGKGHLEC